MKLTNFKHYSLALLCFAASLPAQAQRASTASEMSGYSLMVTAYGSVVTTVQGVKSVGHFLAEQSGLMVRGVSAVGQQSVLALHNGSGALVATVSVAAGSVAAGSQFVGQSVKVVAETSGHAIYAGSQLIAFIPNEIAKQLMFHEKVKG